MQCLFYLHLQPTNVLLRVVPQEYVGVDRTTVDLPIDIFEPTDA